MQYDCIYNIWLGLAVWYLNPPASPSIQVIFAPSACSSKWYAAYCAACTMLRKRAAKESAPRAVGELKWPKVSAPAAWRGPTIPRWIDQWLGEKKFTKKATVIQSMDELAWTNYMILYGY